MIYLDTQVIVPTKVKYSLYIYKKTFDQDDGGNNANSAVSLAKRLIAG